MDTLVRKLCSQYLTAQPSDLSYWIINTLVWQSPIQGYCLDGWLAAS